MPIASQPHATSSDASVGVVIATRNRRDELLVTLAHLTAHRGRPPIVVVDNGSSDGTVAAVRAAHPRVHAVALPSNLGAGARNVGARELATRYVAFADDDSWWADGAFSEAARLFGLHPRCGLIAARMLLGTDERPDPICAQMAASPIASDLSLPGPPVLGFLACGAIVRRDAFLEAGGFEARLGIGGEEQLLAIDLARRGWGLAYVESIVAHHFPSPVRDPSRRRRVQARNVLWTAWLRRTPATAWTRTREAFGAARHDAAARAALLEALRGLPWALRRRERIPRSIEDALARLERG
jgi:GT2 family glycosyltransferase